MNDLRSANVLVVFAHPDDESYGPGATLAALAFAGARLTLLTFTRGEHSTLGIDGVAGPDDLGEVRERELKLAAGELGLAEVRQHRYPDGGLKDAPRPELEELVIGALSELSPALVITFGRGGISGHPDHVTACEVVIGAAREYARRRALEAPPVYGWAMPARIAAELKQRLGRDYPITPDERIVEVRVLPHELEAQWRAVQHHRSQHQPPPWPFEVRVEVQKGSEFLERLIPESTPDPEPLLDLLGRA